MHKLLPCLFHYATTYTTKKTLLLLLLLCLSQTSFTQQKWCNSTTSKQHIDKINTTIKNNLGRLKSLKTLKSAPIKIALSFYHFSRQDDDKLPRETIENAVNHLNEVFSVANMSFFILDDINYVDSNRLDYFDLEENSNDHNEIDNLYRIDGAINIYMFKAVHDGYNIPFSWCGRSYFPEDGVDKILTLESCLSGPLLAHEMGHLFSLLHTHEKYLYGEELVDRSNCNIAGDLLCDTPADPDLSNSTNDNCEYTSSGRDINGDLYIPSVANIMSYAPEDCRNEFTTQQIERIRDTYYAYKTHLSSTSYLALFSAENRDICKGQAVSFTDRSFDAVNYLWTFEGGSPESSSEQHPTIVYNNGGNYNVTLTITTAHGETSSKMLTNYVQVSALASVEHIALAGSFENTELEEDVINPDHLLTFKLTDEVATDGLQSVRINFYDYEAEGGELDYLVLGKINNTIRKTCLISFDYAYSNLDYLDNEFNDKLALVYRYPCTEAWITLWEKQGQDLQTTSPKTSLFIPSPNDWKNIVVPINLPDDVGTIELAFRATNDWGNALYIDNYRVKSFPNIPIITQNGKTLQISGVDDNAIQWFINDIPIENADTTSLDIDATGIYKVIISNGVCTTESNPFIAFEILSVDDIKLKNLKIYPNPSSGKLHLDFPSNIPSLNTVFKISDLSGKLVYNSNYSKSIDLSFLSNGIYVFEIIGEHFKTHRLIVLDKTRL